MRQKNLVETTLNMRQKNLVETALNILGEKQLKVGDRTNAEGKWDKETDRFIPSNHVGWKPGSDQYKEVLEALTKLSNKKVTVEDSEGETRTGTLKKDSDSDYKTYWWVITGKSGTAKPENWDIKYVSEVDGSNIYLSVPFAAGY